jgi:hypothetical protein
MQPWLSPNFWSNQPFCCEDKTILSHSHACRTINWNKCFKKTLTMVLAGCLHYGLL